MKMIFHFTGFRSPILSTLICFLLLLLILNLPADSLAAVPADSGTPGEPTAASPPQQNPGGIWQDVNELGIQSQGQRDIIPDKYRTVAADIAALDNLLAQAPMEGQASGQSGPTVLALPMPDGTFQQFRIEEYPMLVPPHPDIKTYKAYGLDDPTAVGNLDRTPAGFHGMIIAASGTIFIDPYSRGDVTHYLSYYRRDYGNFWGKTFNAEEPIIIPGGWQGGQHEHDVSIAASTGPTRREYRLAAAATVEFTAFHSNAGDNEATKKQKAFNAITTTVNRVNSVYERDFAVRLNLINSQASIYASEPDPYTNGSGATMLGENQSELDAKFGNANYDIGHVFSTGGGGIAGLGVVCASGNKARGVTGSSNPVGDPFDIDFVAHEMGHQFGANHTYNADNAGSCTTGVSTTAYEPGGGTTIMAYAGICSNQNVQSNSDDHFHGGSFDEIVDFITDAGGGDSCAQKVNTGNAAPTVEAGASYTIPQNTPFVLTGSATDSGTLLYAWEQFELGTVWDASQPGKNVLPNTDADAARPIFRSYSPVTVTHRNFPTMTNILDKSYKNTGESLPTRARTIPFRLTVRDGQGGVAFDSTNVTVSTGSGPFRVTAPSSGSVWDPGSQQTVTWNVASTTAAPVSCANVDILLSTDGGQTFATTVLANTPNDGSQTVTIPNAVAINAVLKVQCANNIFFDASSVAVCTSLFNDNHEGTNNWSTNNGAGSNSWTRQSNGANAFSGSNYWFVDNNSGTDTDSRLESPTINVTAGDLFLRVFHKYNLEQQNSTDAFDGGQLEISVNGGAFSYIDQTKFTQNGYTHTAENSTPFINGNKVFSGNSNGYIESIVDLNSLVSQEQNFKIRFREVNDQTNGVDGWYVDDVLACSTTQPNVVNLSLTKSASDSVVTNGDVLTYTLVAKNSGTLTATNVLITDTVPNNTAYVPGSASNGGTAGGGIITWNTGLSLTQNSMLTRTFAVTVTGGTTIANIGYVSATNATGSQASNTVQSSVQADGDGVSDTVEGNAPNSGDGNNDSTPDSQQNHVASLPNAKDGSYVTLAGPAGIRLKNVQASSVPVSPTPPTTATFNLGMFSFDIENITAGQSVTLTMILHNNAQVDDYWKLQNGAWTLFNYNGSTGVMTGTGVITIHLKDGTRGDSDGTANGKIVDPGAPASGAISSYLPIILKNN